MVPHAKRPALAMLVGALWLTAANPALAGSPGTTREQFVSLLANRTNLEIVNRLHNQLTHITQIDNQLQKQQNAVMTNGNPILVRLERLDRQFQLQSQRITQRLARLNSFVGNPAVNYFYGVRPGTVGGNYAGAFGYGGAANVQRQTYFPYVDTLAELEPTDPRSGMPPTGHPSGFNNTLGYYGPLSGAAARLGQAGQGQQGMGGRKAALQPPRR